MSSVSVGKRLHKPKKPYPDFPLFAHATKRWAKKIRGKLHYFGPWDDPDGALERYVVQRDDLHAGRWPRVESDGTTIRDLCNRFLTTKRHLLETGEITQYTFDDYHRTCERVVRVFGKDRLVEDLRAEDFELLRHDMARSRGVVALGNEINRSRILFKFAYDADLIERPVKFGPTFKRPSRRVLRIERSRKIPRMFEPDQLRAMLSHAPLPMKAMIFLGVNCGFGNADVSLLPMSALDLGRGWVEYARRKTGIERRCPLWPETTAALSEWLGMRPTPKTAEHGPLVFVTSRGGGWQKETSDNPVTKEFRKLLGRLGIYRPGLSFYALRHTFATIGGETRDQVAVDHIMGHARNDMASLYRERISDERLIAVTDYVRNWLFSDAPTVKRTQ